MADSSYTGFQDFSSAASDRNALDFIVRMVLGQLATATVVKVLAVYPPDDPVGPVGTVDVQPLVNIIDGADTASPHGPLHGLPYFRLQGGANAVILDPEPGDLGLAVFASRDISSVKAQKAQANPGSRRQFDMADGLYLGGFLNGTPTQYVQFTSSGMALVSPTKITLQAPAIALNGAVTGNSSATFTGEIMGNGKALSTHKHTGVQTGSGVSGPPQ